MGLVFFFASVKYILFKAPTLKASSTSHTQRFISLFVIASSGHADIAKEERYVCEVVYNVLQKVNKDIQKTGTIKHKNT